MNDTQLIHALRTMFEQIDPVPESLRRRIIDDFDIRHMDAMLARIVFDSAGTGALAGVRSSATLRQLTFETETITLEVTLDPRPDGLRIIGQVIPSTASPVTVLAGETAYSATTDALGRFQVDGVAAGALAIRIGDSFATETFHP